MKVLYMVNVPAPYMVSYFNELGKYCDLTVIFEKSTSSERDESWKKYSFINFKGIILKGISTAVDMAFCPQVIRYLKKNKYDFIISSAMATPTGILAIEYMKLRGIPFYLESEGGFAKDGKGLKEHLKKRVMSGAKGYFSTTAIDDEYFITYGALPDRIYKYPFTSLYEKDILPSPLSNEEKKNIRDKIGISDSQMVISVGQYIYRKGFDLLIQAANQINKNIGVYIVGGVPTQEYIELRNQIKADNVHFVDFLSKEELAEYYKASDVFVLPTREDTWGLVINEAMAYGLPVISTDRCIAASELVDNTNGRIIPTDSVEALSKAITDLISNRNLLELGRKSIDKIKWYTFESMAKVHMDFFKKEK